MNYMESRSNIIIQKFTKIQKQLSKVFAINAFSDWAIIGCHMIIFSSSHAVALKVFITGPDQLHKLCPISNIMHEDHNTFPISCGKLALIKELKLYR